MNEEFNAELRAWMARYKVPAQELARHLGMSRYTLHRRMTGASEWRELERREIARLRAATETCRRVP